VGPSGSAPAGPARRRSACRNACGCWPNHDRQGHQRARYEARPSGRESNPAVRYVMVAQLERNNVSNKAASTFEHADDALGSLQAMIGRFDREHVPEKTSKALEDVGLAV
jgi:hypothetical protein